MAEATAEITKDSNLKLFFRAPFGVILGTMYGWCLPLLSTQKTFQGFFRIFLGTPSNILHDMGLGLLITMGVAYLILRSTSSQKVRLDPWVRNRGFKSSFILGTILGVVGFYITFIEVVLPLL